MIPREPDRELAALAEPLTAEGWRRLDTLPVTGPPDGVHVLLITSPVRAVLLSATWRPGHRSTALSVADPDPDRPGALLRGAEAVNLPVPVLLAAARAAEQAPLPGPRLAELLAFAGWTREKPVRTPDGVDDGVLRSPDLTRTATATRLHASGRTEPGPWLIERGDLPRGGPDHDPARAHAGPATPAAVLAALALTGPDDPISTPRPDSSTHRRKEPR